MQNRKENPVVINLHIGKLIEKVEFVVPAGLEPAERELAEKQCLSLSWQVEEKIRQSLSSLLESVSSILPAENEG